MEWRLTVIGDPVPQPRPRFSARGGFARAYTPTKHPINAYRQAVADAWSEQQLVLLCGPLVVDIEAVFARPKSHLRKNGLAKGAPAYPPKCDWDNLGKGVCDALTGLAWQDDDQIVDGRCRKRYAEPGEVGHTRMTVRRA